MESILIAETAKNVSQAVRDALKSDYIIESASNLDDALTRLQGKYYAFLFLDTDLISKPASTADIKAGLQGILRYSPNTQIIAVSSKEKIRDAVKAVKAGASDYVTYPIDPAEVILVVESACENQIVRAEIEHLREKLVQDDILDNTRTRSAEMEAVYERIRKVAPTKTTVLLLGETGTGKSFLARQIHHHSNRRDDQFISVHCGAIPETLLESELFGHEKGAFTGAVKRKRGKFEIAHGGTLFLDEIGTLTPSAQIKFLQVLQDRIVQRVGSESTLQVDVRVVSANNEDLKRACDEGRFRRDLYYRLNVFPIEIPPLRKRVEDIPHLADIFLRRFETEGQKGIQRIEPEVVELLKGYHWPGNIRELENVIERAYVLASGQTLTRFEFPDEIISSNHMAVCVPGDASLSLAKVRSKAVEAAEFAYLRAVLAENKGKLRDVADVAGITTRQLHKLLTKHGIRKEEFKPPKGGFQNKMSPTPVLLRIHVLRFFAVHRLSASTASISVR